jgi:hypothetical protein
MNAVPGVSAAEGVALDRASGLKPPTSSAADGLMKKPERQWWEGICMPPEAPSSSTFAPPSRRLRAEAPRISLLVIAAAA